MTTVNKQTAMSGKSVIPLSKKRKSIGNEPGFITLSLIGAATSLILGLILLIFAAIVAYSASDPDALSFPMAAVALYLGAVLGGIVSSKIGRRAAYGPAAVAAVIQSALILIVSVFMKEHYTYLLLPKLALHAGVFGAYLFGAFIGKPRAKSARARAAKRRRAV